MVRHIFQVGQWGYTLRVTPKVSRLNLLHCECSSDATDNAEGNHTLPFSFLDVFTWAILSGKKELAKVLWEKGTYAIATALFATKLLKEMVEHSQDDHQVIDSSEELIGLAK